MGESSSALRLALLAPTPAIRAAEVSDFYARLPHLRRLDLAGQVLLFSGCFVPVIGEALVDSLCINNFSIRLYNS